MKIDKTNLIYFSPTGTSKTIVESLGLEIGINRTIEYDLTHDKPISFETDGNENSVTIIGVPVYRGRVPVEATQRLKKIKTNKTLAVIVVVYGNRAFEDSLLELKDIANTCGFNVIAAGAFIGEHSFTITNKTIAAGRPDQKDLLKVKEFGEKIKIKLQETIKIKKLDELKIPGNYPYKDPGPFSAISPETKNSDCHQCCTCEDVCPVKAVVVTKTAVITDKESCIWCCACVKSCPQKARKFDNPKINGAIEWLFTNFSQRKEPEFFL
jgi:ferredoxin